MLYIAFKRAKNTLLYQQIKDQIPAEYIMEYYDTSKFPKGFFKASDGWEIEPEEIAKLELDKNEEIINTFKQQQHELTQAQKRDMKDAILKEMVEDREMFKEYLQFKAWQKKMITQGYLHHINKELSE